MDSVYENRNACCGCGLCAEVCPKSAITMQPSDGFLYPVIRGDLCVDCGLCRKSCQFAKPKVTEPLPLLTFAAKCEDRDVRRESSSGGIFTVLSDEILRMGGKVYGADFDADMNLRHIGVQTSAERDRMRGAKYIQSSTDGIYRRIKEDLKKGVPVLFTGTPCQIAALKKSVDKFPCDNLYTMDLICHGVPSGEVWKKYVAFIEKKYGKKLAFYKFRNKAVGGWKTYSAKLYFTDGTTKNSNDDIGSFIELFRYDVCMRPSCAACPYASAHRQGDITVSDFWGIENVFPDFYDELGVSAVMIHNEQGKKLLNALQTHAQMRPCTLEQIAARQPNLSAPSSASQKAASFQRDLKTMPFEKVLKKYTRVGYKRRVKDFIKKVLRR